MDTDFYTSKQRKQRVLNRGSWRGERCRRGWAVGGTLSEPALERFEVKVNDGRDVKGEKLGDDKAANDGET